MNKTLTTMILSALLAMAATACGDPCLSRCQEGKDMGCISESTDCEMSCEDSDRARVTARGHATTAGCISEFDATVSCTDSSPVCSTGSCSAETSALTSCFIAFCSDNPSSDACM